MSNFNILSSTGLFFMVGTRFLKKIIQVYDYFKIYVILIAEEEEEEELGMSNELTFFLNAMAGALPFN